MPIRAMYWPGDGEPAFAHPNIEFVPGDLRDRDRLVRALEGIEVVHNISALYRTTNVPEQAYYDVNVTDIRNIAEVAAAAKVSASCSARPSGSTATSSTPRTTRTRRSSLTTITSRPSSRARRSHRSAAASSAWRWRWCARRPFYGPRETRFLGLAKLLQKGRFLMFDDGEVLYHFLHVEDLCDALMLAAEHPEAVSDAFIIADEGAISLSRTVAVMCDKLGVAPPRLVGEGGKGRVRRAKQDHGAAADHHTVGEIAAHQPVRIAEAGGLSAVREQEDARVLQPARGERVERTAVVCRAPFRQATSRWLTARAAPAVSIEVTFACSQT